MARTKLNLNRFRKIYPQMRKSPSWFVRGEAITKEAVVIDLAVPDPLTFTTSLSFNSPVVVATAQDNQNVWVSTITGPDGAGLWEITVAHSDSSSTSKIHVVVYEGNPV